MGNFSFHLGIIVHTHKTNFRGLKLHYPQGKNVVQPHLILNLHRNISKIRYGWYVTLSESSIEFETIYSLLDLLLYLTNLGFSSAYTLFLIKRRFTTRSTINLIALTTFFSSLNLFLENRNLHVSRHLASSL